MDANERTARQYRAAAAILLAGLAAFLLAAHYVKAYSDPCDWLRRAQDFSAGHLATRWAPVFPMFMAVALKVVGPIGVFLINLPLLVLLAWLVRRVTMQCTARAGDAGLAGLMALALFILVNRSLLLELQNPYREALAFCLLFGGVSLLLDVSPKGGLWRAAASAGLIGLSVGVRETCALVLPVALVWLTIPWLRARKAHAAVGLLTFAGVLLLGLIPFLIQNYMQSGHMWIPSYAARKWAWMSGGGSARWDIPIPGMSVHYFALTGRKMLTYFAGKYSWWGALLVLAGLVAAWRRRLVAVLGFIVPALLVNLLFYAFWYTKSWRFLFAIDLFVTPLMALGATFLLGLAADRLKPVATWLVTGAVLLNLASGWAGQPPRLQVWHVPELRRFLDANVDQPCSFLGPAHLTQMLSWFLQAPRCRVPTLVNATRVRNSGMEEALRATAAAAFAVTASDHVYWCGGPPPPLLKQWFEFTPTFSLGSAPVPFDRYGERLTDRLYRMQPWSSNAVERTLKHPSPRADSLLKVDCFRLWDYPGRTWCRLTAGDHVLEQTVSNGVHFVVVPGRLARDPELRIRIESDAPVPPDPVLKLIPLNSEQRIEFGAETDGWYYPHLSSQLLDVVPVKYDSCLLFDEGRLALPTFATPDREVFAELRVEYVSAGRQAPPCMTADSGAGAACARLPGHGLASRMTISLGPGTGSLAWRNVDLSVRSSCDASNATPRTGNRGQFVKVYRARVYPFSWDPRESVLVNVGGAEDDPYLLEGFYGTEKHEGRTYVRWTAPRWRMRLPISRSFGSLAFTIRHVPVRPSDRPPNPRFNVAGWDVPTNRIEMLSGDAGTQTFYFTAPSSRFTGSGPVVLEMTTDPWVPAETGGRDHRELGLMLDSVEVTPAAFE